MESGRSKTKLRPLGTVNCRKARNPMITGHLGELFLYFSDEMSDITWIQAFQMLLQMFRTMLSDNTELSDEKIDELANAFMDAQEKNLKDMIFQVPSLSLRNTYL